MTPRSPAPGVKAIEARGRRQAACGPADFGRRARHRRACKR
ncbi:hypothetical protein C7S16_6953 [Burkholderia thailandensis]|uniref:Uncharacterized protein n=1 Tax=Burkholderia thailandensis TaxID=57975 RepID=A0AAW9CSE1_BURTH|nr:hypothetical protein [Burkholderia thailandensis]MDW9253282.1 hypothetical protein [Burkholderia thailandensis]